MLGDLANSQPRTEATGRSSGGILLSVSHIPMVLQVCFRSPDCEPGHFLLVSVTPSLSHFPPAPTCPLYVDMFWKTDPNTENNLWNKWYVFVGVWLHVSHSSVNGKFPDGLSSVLPHFFPFLCHPPVRFLSCLTPVFVSSREGIENTTCHRLFGGLSLVLHGGMFIIPSL